tara:strand:- start:920 stop:1561 length:642 start_codon:yes stop_codon:yes gene_type:complete
MVDQKKTSKKVPKSKPVVKSVSSPYVPFLKNHYFKKVIKSMMDKHGYSNVMQVPRIDSIALNMGIGDGKANPKKLESGLSEMTAISGQSPLITKSKQDVSNFKIRKGYPVGCKVTLRSNKMYEFLDRLISIALPRARDFKGLSFKSFDGRGNYNFGIKEQIVFTEIDYDDIDSIRGMNVTIVTTSKTDQEAYTLLREFGFPLREKNNKKNEAV